MLDLGAQKGKIKGVCIVRDSNGNPKFDDWDNIDAVFLSALTASDLAYIKQQQQLGDK
tara:strand:- start:760 stop:933 length:174 start_codon:yes stop_codon:yes gene_type:complete